MFVVPSAVADNAGVATSEKNAPMAGEVSPIRVPSMAPPLISTFDRLRVAAMFSVPLIVVAPLIVFVPVDSPIVLAAAVPVPNVFVRFGPVPTVVAPEELSVVNAPELGLDVPIEEFVIVSPETELVKDGAPVPLDLRSCPEDPEEVKS